MPKSRPLPPIDEMRKRLAYRSDGVLIWKRPTAKNVKPGNKAGHFTSDGYLRVRFNRQSFLSHRIVWAILKREDPLEFSLDHINGDTLDNRIENLRKATAKQNQWNQKGAKGYYFNKERKKWKAHICLNRKTKHLGLFDTEEQAREAYLRAKEKLHGEFMPTDMKHELGQIDGPTSQLNIFDD
jgi:hypothetical protein